MRYLLHNEKSLVKLNKDLTFFTVEANFLIKKYDSIAALHANSLRFTTR